MNAAKFGPIVHILIVLDLNAPKCVGVNCQRVWLRVIVIEKAYMIYLKKK